MRLCGRTCLSKESIPSIAAGPLLSLRLKFNRAARSGQRNSIPVVRLTRERWPKVNPFHITWMRSLVGSRKASTRRVRLAAETAALPGKTLLDPTSSTCGRDGHAPKATRQRKVGGRAREIPQFGHRHEAGECPQGRLLPIRASRFVESATPVCLKWRSWRSLPTYGRATRFGARRGTCPGRSP